MARRGASTFGSEKSLAASAPRKTVTIVTRANCQTRSRVRNACGSRSVLPETISYWLMTEPSLKIGRYIEITRPPMTTPRKRMTIGSIRAVRLATALSTSSS